MLRNNLHYTIGAYNESPEGTLSTSGPALLAQTLAWAVQNDIPFQDVILSLTKKGSGSLKRTIFLLPMSRRWERCLTASYYDLIKGIPLYKTLRYRFEYFLPEYYLQAVERAEKQGNLKTILPAFAARVNLSSRTKNFYRQALMFPFLEVLIIFSQLSVMVNLLLPRLNRIFVDACNIQAVIPANVIFIPLLFLLWQIIFAFIIYSILWYLVGRLFPRLRYYILMFLREIFVFIPPFRRHIYDTAMLDLSSSMASCLNAGQDITGAAEFSEKTSGNFWMKRRLHRFIEKVKKGENWLDAWRSMNLKQNTGELFIRNSAASENPAAGFDSLCNWLYHNQIRRKKNNAVWLTVILTLINSTLVFFVVVTVFRILIRIIYAS